MNTRRRIVLILAACLASALCVAGGGTEPLSEIPAAQREALTKRLGAYVEAYRGRKWDRLYELVSDTGKGGADRQTFIAAMKHEHGIDFAQMPDLLEFNPDRSEKIDDGVDVYGCGKARREGMMFNGIAVVHAVYEHNDWFFTGWTFTEFPNEPCKAFADPKWQPSNRIKWNRSMEEIANFKSQGAPFHIDSPR